MPFLSPDLPVGTKRFIVEVPDTFVPAFYGAVAELLPPENWEEFGALSQDDCATAAGMIFDSIAEHTEEALIYPDQVSPAALYPYSMNGFNYRSRNSNINHYGFLVCGPAAGAWMKWKVLLAAGTWEFTFYTGRNNDRGIHQFSVDGTLIGAQDCYAASVDWNWSYTVSGVEIAAHGNHEIMLYVSSKNASSLNYYLVVMDWVARRTG